MSRYRIAYYSGTGGTEKAARLLCDDLSAFGTVSIEEITHRNSANTENVDMLFLLYPVHAFHAPSEVYRWILDLPLVTKLPTVVISISGGGEISPNTACRVSCIKKLEKRGYAVFYENMIVMPSNFLTTTDDRLSFLLLKTLPKKTEQIVKDVTSGVRCRTKPFLKDRMLSYCAEIERPMARLWGRHIKVQDRCVGCGICSTGCPSGNITMQSDKPVFGHNCQLCLKCIYQCPLKALTPGFAKMIILEEGYNLSCIEQKMKIMDTELQLQDYAKSHAWSGVLDYLEKNITT